MQFFVRHPVHTIRTKSLIGADSLHKKNILIQMPALCAKAGMDFSKILVKLAKNQLFMRGLAPISKEFANFVKNIAQRAGLKN